MEINIHTSKDIKLSDAVRDKIQEELGHLKHLQDNSVHIALSIENDGKNHAKITLNTLHTQFHSDGSANTLFAAIHDAAMKLNKQIDKHDKSK